MSDNTLNFGKIWVIGNKGMLGTSLCRALTENNIDFVGTDREVDILDINALESFAAGVSSCNSNEAGAREPDLEITSGNEAGARELGNISFIINCSAYTAVDKAEDDVEMATRLNVEGPRNIATIAKKIGAKMIHISTDYVFDGKGNAPYTEEKTKAPLGVYGKTKSDGEDEVLRILPTSSYIVRTAWLYGFDGKNFVYTMTNLMNSKETLKVVNDQKGTPTFAADLANTLLAIVKQNPASGIYHFTNEGEITWYEFALAIYELGTKFGRINNSCEISPCTSSEFPAKVTRPTYSVLSKEKVKNTLHISVPDWKTSLETFIRSPLWREN